eukprot:TRINITY_DN959_c1_g1_i1.p1 TRINITY_DN959_c1_g1~~TRINITY_DN959_c1_g1_i1.p1  ORF type:complete len:727 (+),score=126.25 TRINITY_DN959_c1_g1_i1:40-2220(+)
MDLTLQEMITKIKECKTKSEERALVASISADLRTNLRGDNSEFRNQNLFKLLFINTMGYPTHWAQLECMNIISKTSFSDKRAGYLALSILLDEQQEVLLLFTNAILRDLQDKRPHVISVALSSFANIADETMARAAVPVIEGLLSHKRRFIRKKALICATKIVRKVPDVGETFIPKIKILLNTDSNSVLITTISLITELSKNLSLLPQLKEISSDIVNAFERVMNIHSEEFYVDGAYDPFLQVRLLRLLRILADHEEEENKEDSSHKVQSLLKKILKKTFVSNNVSNSIIYECINTTLNLHCNEELRMLAVNKVGELISSDDRNTRFVALSLLNKLVRTDKEAILTYQKPILMFLQERDKGITQLALKLIYNLINHENVRMLVRELIEYLRVSKDDLNDEHATNLCYLVQKYSPSNRWMVDSLLNIFGLYSSSIPENILYYFIGMITNYSDIQLYATQKMFLLLGGEVKNQQLFQACIWSVGEYGKLILGSVNGIDKVTPESLIKLLIEKLHSHDISETSQAYILTALAKLSQLNHNCISLVESELSQYSKSKHIDLQNRASEFDEIIKNPQLRSVLAQLPPISLQHFSYESEDSVHQNDGVTKSNDSNGNVLIGDLLGTSSHTTHTTTNFTPVQNPIPVQNVLDLLDLKTPSTTEYNPFSGLTPSLLLNPTPTNNEVATPRNNLLDNLLGTYNNPSFTNIGFTTTTPNSTASPQGLDLLSSLLKL